MNISPMRKQLEHHPSLDTDTTPTLNFDNLHEQIRHSLIMMVDDEPLVMEALQTFLEDQGYANFIQLEQSNNAVREVGSNRPDVLLLDLKMPGLNGFDILKQLRAQRSTTYLPVIVLTSSSDSATKLKALELGATDFLAKPIDPSELALRLRNTLMVKAYQDRLIHYDTLTGLPNRKLFLDRLSRTLRKADQEQKSVAILNIAIDRFQQVNDSLGPKAGDLLLQKVATRLLECLQLNGNPDRESGSCLARLGGDEFSVLLYDGEDAAATTNIAQQLRFALQRGFDVAGQELIVTASIGIALYPLDARDTDSLMQHAGSATAYAKEQGKDTHEFYSAQIHARSKERLNLELSLRHALERRELTLHYQPKMDAKSGRIMGMEALLRWFRPDQGMVPPDLFIPVAEEIGIIGPIGEWVIREACLQNAAWQSIGLGPLKVSVNVSGHQFHGSDLGRIIHQSLNHSGLSASCLMVEITESMLTGDIERNIDVLHKIKATGASLSIDDFGTGYSSLSYLKRFPIDELKIDRSFIIDVPHKRDDSAIVKAIIAMAQSLELSVVAEGVENEQQLSYLRGLGCDIIQGYYYSRPLAAKDFTEFCLATVDHDKILNLENHFEEAVVS